MNAYLSSVKDKLSDQVYQVVECFREEVCFQLLTELRDRFNLTQSEYQIGCNRLIKHLIEHIEKRRLSSADQDRLTRCKQPLTELVSDHAKQFDLTVNSDIKQVILNKIHDCCRTYKAAKAALEYLQQQQDNQADAGMGAQQNAGAESAASTSYARQQFFAQSSPTTATSATTKDAVASAPTSHARQKRSFLPWRRNSNPRS